jgi:hypothetical protein
MRVSKANDRFSNMGDDSSDVATKPTQSIPPAFLALGVLCMVTSCSAVVVAAFALSEAKEASTRANALESRLASVPKGLSSPEKILGTWETDPTSPEWNAPWVIPMGTDVHIAAKEQEHLGGLSDSGSYSINRIRVVIQSINTQVHTLDDNRTGSRYTLARIATPTGPNNGAN